jgi:hypothetical protein
MMALGEGGPGDPKRYCLNPITVAMASDKEEFERVSAMLKADPGAALASAKLMQTWERGE